MDSEISRHKTHIDKLTRVRLASDKASKLLSMEAVHARNCRENDRDVLVVLYCSMGEYSL
jgi:hypothetical protein